MKIWLDDTRDPSDKYIQENFGATSDMVWIKDAKLCVKLLESGQVEEISFDHDLGYSDETYYPELTTNPLGYVDGYDVAKALVRLVFEKKIKSPKWRVHSSNPVGNSQINKLLSRYTNDI